MKKRTRGYKMLFRELFKSKLHITDMFHPPSRDKDDSLQTHFHTYVLTLRSFPRILRPTKLFLLVSQFPSRCFNFSGYLEPLFICQFSKGPPLWCHIWLLGDLWRNTQLQSIYARLGRGGDVTGKHVELQRASCVQSTWTFKPFISTSTHSQTPTLCLSPAHTRTHQFRSRRVFWSTASALLDLQVDTRHHHKPENSPRHRGELPVHSVPLWPSELLRLDKQWLINTWSENTNTENRVFIPQVEAQLKAQPCLYRWLFIVHQISNHFTF